MATDMNSAARERVLAVADQMFSERGYSAVTLRDIANALGIRQASIYHHVPGGKEELFVEVTERSLERHRVELERAIGGAGDDLRARLQAAAYWLVQQHPIDLARMVRSDMPAISEDHARRLTQAALQSLVMPIERAFQAARTGAEQKWPSDRLLASSFLSIIETIQVAERFSPQSKEAMADSMIDVIINGLRPR